MLANAMCVIWCGRVCLFSVGLVVDFQWSVGVLL